MVLYLLALVMLPCNDACEELHQYVPLTFSQAQDHHPQDKDVCSPLCGCSCCSVHVIFQAPMLAHALSVSMKQKFIERTALTVSDLYTTIWQPPRLS